MSRTAPTKSVLALSAVAAALLSLSACGSGGTSQSAAGTTGAGGSAPQAGAPSGAPGGFGGGGFPGANGKIAALSGKTLQVQGMSGQVAVTYTASTTFTDETTVPASAVKVGSCVFVSPDRSSSSSTSSNSGTVTAGSVRITAATNGSCDQGFGGTRGSGAPSGMPTDKPSGMPSGIPGGGRFGFGAFGKVTAVSGTGFTVASSMPSATGASSTSEVTVTVSSSTTYTTTKSATASALKVGLCASANGSADDTGALTAQRISLRQPVDGECTVGSGGRGGFGGPAGGAQ